MCRPPRALPFDDACRCPPSRHRQLALLTLSPSVHYPKTAMGTQGLPLAGGSKIDNTCQSGTPPAKALAYWRAFAPEPARSSTIATQTAVTSISKGTGAGGHGTGSNRQHGSISEPPAKMLARRALALGPACTSTTAASTAGAAGSRAAGAAGTWTAGAASSKALPLGKMGGTEIDNSGPFWCLPLEVALGI